MRVASSPVSLHETKEGQTVSGAAPYPTLAKKLHVVTMARNEERDLPFCLAAVPAGIAHTIIDSGSKDATPDIARAAGATVVFNEFHGFAAQHNFGLTRAGVTAPWVLFVDADEAYTSEFWDWAEKWLAEDQPVDCVWISSFIILDGKVLKHAPGYPLWHPRLFRSGKPAFVVGDAGPDSEAVAPELRCIYIDKPYLHYWHSGPLQPWMEKHLRLAVADQSVDNATTGQKTLRMRVNRAIRTGMIKTFGRFFFHYVWSLGFLDGAAGYRYSMMYSWYEASKWLLRLERKERLTITLPDNVVRRTR